MGRNIGRRVAAVMGLGLLFAACGGSSKTPNKSDTTPPATTICDAGSKRCDGLNIKACSDDGTTESLEQTCLPTQACSDGACTETACVPNTRFCKDGAIWKCDATGGGSTLSQMCDTGKFCRDDDGSAECSDQACTPNAAMCDTNTATTCAADGSGPAPGGTDCSGTKQICYQGQCRDRTCMSGMKLCQHNSVYVCAANGTDVSLLSDCQANEVCDGDMGTCRPKVCDPGKVDCDATRIVKCNTYGSGWDQSGTDCAAGSQICVAGECKKQTCVASSTFCQDGNVYQCDAAGVTSALSYPCTPSYSHCVPYPSSNNAACASNDCQANQVLCDQNVVKTCNADGSLPTTGTDCGADSYCENGACKAKVCDPYTYYCKGNDVYYCDYLGGPSAGEQPVQTCPSDTICKIEAPSGPICVPLPCTPGETACIANQIGTCAADSKSLSKVTDDCTTSSSVCDTDGKCATSVSETLGVAEDATTEQAGNVIGDVIQVGSARKVTELQANLVLAAPRELRWVIYEQSGVNFIARVDKVISNQTGTGFFSSGPISYSLKAGKTYCLALAISGGNFISYFDTAPFAGNASFGTLLGRVDSYYATTVQTGVDTSMAYQMKVTTALP